MSLRPNRQQPPSIQTTGRFKAKPVVFYIGADELQQGRPRSGTTAGSNFCVWQQEIAARFTADQMKLPALDLVTEVLSKGTVKRDRATYIQG
jgi:hypothetical protein